MTSSINMLQHMISRLRFSGKLLHQNIIRCSSTATPAPKIRQMHAKESPALAISQTADGARLRNADLQVIHGLDKDGYFLGVNDQGEIVGTIGAIRLTDELGFIGFYHVTEKFQNKGFEEKLWEKAIEHLGDRNIGIEVAVDDVQKCQDLGFKEEWKTGRFQGVGVNLPPEILVNKAIRPLQGMAMGKVVDYDTSTSGIHKVPLVLGWCKAPSTGYAALEDDERVMGYGVIHPLHNPITHRIAPLLTENVSIAQMLLLTLLSSIPNQKVFIDAPLRNPSFTRILTMDLKMEQIGETVRMYTKGNPGFPVQKAFGILSPDAGC
ncbi:uncharacterized protein [Amphiura filiformis]|uniref:uncharacterized protein n=1 Tax=Amphiura filiformis TaxID=82378 RepID=UPI003B20CE82